MNVIFIVYKNLNRKNVNFDVPKQNCWLILCRYNAIVEECSCWSLTEVYFYLAYLHFASNNFGPMKYGSFRRSQVYYGWDFRRPELHLWRLSCNRYSVVKIDVEEDKLFFTCVFHGIGLRVTVDSIYYNLELITYYLYCKTFWHNNDCMLSSQMWWTIYNILIFFYFFGARGKSSNTVCRSGWSGKQCQTSSD